ncbi:hypothetical protein MMC25_007932 [Agyrium rufum]|nr:hypothetical protein [Agyrium rufum]
MAQGNLWANTGAGGVNHMPMRMFAPDEQDAGEEGYYVGLQAALFEEYANMVDGDVDTVDGQAGTFSEQAGMVYGQAGAFDGQAGAFDGQAGDFPQAMDYQASQEPAEGYMPLQAPQPQTIAASNLAIAGNGGAWPVNDADRQYLPDGNQMQRRMTQSDAVIYDTMFEGELVFDSEMTDPSQLPFLLSPQDAYLDGAGPSHAAQLPSPMAPMVPSYAQPMIPPFPPNAQHMGSMFPPITPPMGFMPPPNAQPIGPIFSPSAQPMDSAFSPNVQPMDSVFPPNAQLMFPIPPPHGQHMVTTFLPPAQQAPPPPLLIPPPSASAAPRRRSRNGRHAAEDAHQGYIPHPTQPNPNRYCLYRANVRVNHDAKSEDMDYNTYVSQLEAAGCQGAERAGRGDFVPDEGPVVEGGEEEEEEEEEWEKWPDEMEQDATVAPNSGESNQASVLMGQALGQPAGISVQAAPVTTTGLLTPFVSPEVKGKPASVRLAEIRADKTPDV